MFAALFTWKMLKSLLCAALIAVVAVGHEIDGTLLEISEAFS